jgi:hypothetical protein
MACALRAATSLQQGNARITAGGCQSFCLSVRLLPAPSAVLLAGGGALSPDEGAILPAMPAAPQGFLSASAPVQALKSKRPDWR